MPFRRVLRPGPGIGPRIFGPLAARVLLARDSFTDASTTALTSHAADKGGAWLYLTANAWQIQASNTAKKTTNSATVTRDVAVTSAGRADYRVRATVAYGSAPTEGLVVRSTGTESDGYFVVVNNGTLWIISEYDGVATFSTRTSVAGVATSTTGALEVVAKGATLQVYWNGALVLTYASATRNRATGTYAGIRAAATANAATFDDFQVRGL